MNFDSKKNQMKFHVQLIKMQMAYEEAYYTFAHLLDSDKNSIMLLEKYVEFFQINFKLFKDCLTIYN